MEFFIRINNYFFDRWNHRHYDYLGALGANGMDEAS